MSEHSFPNYIIVVSNDSTNAMPEDIASKSQISTSTAIEFEMETLFSIMITTKKQLTQTPVLRTIPRPSRMNQNDDLNANRPPPIRFVRKNRGSVNSRIGPEFETSVSTLQANYQHQHSNACPTTAPTSAYISSSCSYSTSDYDKMLGDLMLGDDEHYFPPLFPELSHSLNST